jgi:hypothetical protein
MSGGARFLIEDGAICREVACSTCRHWQRLDAYRPDKDTNKPSAFGRCLSVESDADHSVSLPTPDSGAPSLSDVDVEAIGDRDAVAADAEDYFATLITRETFGCKSFASDLGTKEKPT